LRLDRAIATAILGATTGDSLGYCLGRFGGKPFVEKYPKRIPFFARQFDRAQALFKQHGHWAVFVGRFVTGLRIFSGILAGLFRMPYRRFLFFNFTGAVSWALTFGCVGFIFGESWDGLVAFVRRFQRLTWAVVASAALAAAIAYWRRHRSPR
jgi:membrane protein DedA with SNARE-associated domain